MHANHDKFVVELLGHILRFFDFALSTLGFMLVWSVQCVTGKWTNDILSLSFPTCLVHSDPHQCTPGSHMSVLSFLRGCKAECVLLPMSNYAPYLKTKCKANVLE